MNQPSSQKYAIAAAPGSFSPKFLVLEQPRLRPAIVLLAAALAAVALLLISVGLRHSRSRRLLDERGQVTRTPAGSSTPAADDDKDDDPSQVDVIAMGDPADPPVPARRFGRSGRVHPTIIVRLPRFGPQSGLIPSSTAGHLLYGWLAAFNQANQAAMEGVLPNDAQGMTAAAQMELREQTGGFNLLSAKEVEPGVLVFRLRDQTPLGTEVLGTLVMKPGSNPAAIESFSMRAVPAED